MSKSKRKEYFDTVVLGRGDFVPFLGKSKANKLSDSEMTWLCDKIGESLCDSDGLVLSIESVLRYNGYIK